MRKFFDRLRRWLIKKLGGYTEQFPPLQRQIVRAENVNPQKVQAQLTIVAPTPEIAADFEGFCKSRVMEKLVQGLEESDYIQWENRLDMFERRVDVRATLYVVNANDLPPSFQCWVE